MLRAYDVEFTGQNVFEHVRADIQGKKDGWEGRRWKLAGKMVIFAGWSSSRGVPVLEMQRGPTAPTVEDWQRKTCDKLEFYNTN